MAEGQSRGWWRENLRWKNVWEEMSGSLGDLGTFVPILLALALVNGVDLGTTLLFTGLYNVITGVFFGVPMPVQPMKSIAAVAIAEGDRLTVPQIMAAGLSTAFVLLFLGGTGLMSFVNRVVPLPVVRGIQLSQGISFASTAVNYIRKNQDFQTGKSGADREWLGFDGFLLAISALLFVILSSGAGGAAVEHSSVTREEVTDTSRETLLGSDSENRTEEDVEYGRSRWQTHVVPSAMIVFFVGVILAIVRDPSILGDLRLGPSVPHIVKISWEDWKIGFTRAAVPQIPLSVLNSVLAVCKLSNDLFPSKDVTPFAVSTSVGIMNAVGCWFGAMPVCHGAGGLAGQYRFGARSGLSVTILGTVKLLLGLILGSSLLRLLTLFPIGLLGVLLLFSGMELAMACRDQSSRRDSFVMLVVTVTSLAMSSAAMGFICGKVTHLLLEARQFSLTRYVVRG